jgi:hypothetical protein
VAAVVAEERSAEGLDEDAIVDVMEIGFGEVAGDCAEGEWLTVVEVSPLCRAGLKPVAMGRDRGYPGAILAMGVLVDRVGDGKAAVGHDATGRLSVAFTGRASELRRLILPRLSGIEGRTLAGATGLSVGYRDQIRDGKRVPHVRHWAPLQLVGLNHEERTARPK